MGYCKSEDIFELKDSMTIARWIRLGIPDFISFEKRTGIIAVLSDDEKVVFEKAYSIDFSGEYRLSEEINDNEKNVIVNIFTRIYGSRVIEATIEDVTAEIEMSLTTGGYVVPVPENALYFSLVKRICKYLTLYTLLVNGGALEVEGDKQFIEMCERMKEELTKIAEGKMKLPLKGVNQVFVKSPGKIADWEKY